MGAAFPAEEDVPEETYAQNIAQCMADMYRDESYSMPNGRKWDEKAMAFGASKKELVLEKYPMRPGLLAHEQKKEKWLQKCLEKKTAGYSTTTIAKAELITLAKTIVATKSLQQLVVDWYHQYLSHPGQHIRVANKDQLVSPKRSISSKH